MSHKLYNGALITCVDGWWTSRIMQVAGEILGGQTIDLYTRPGAAKTINHGCHVTEDLIDKFVRVSVGLHGVKDIVLCNHWDCGAYGGSQAFAGPEAERDVHLEHLRNSTNILQRAIQYHLQEILHSPNLYHGLKMRNIQHVADNGLRIHPILLCPSDFTQPFAGPEHCVALKL